MLNSKYGLFGFTEKKLKSYEANFKLIHNYNTSKFITRKLNKADRLHALILHYVYMLAKSGNNESAYRLTSLWIFMHKWRATNMVPHLTRRHCEDDCLLATKPNNQLKTEKKSII